MAFVGNVAFGVTFGVRSGTLCRLDSKRGGYGSWTGPSRRRARMVPRSVEMKAVKDSDGIVVTATPKPNSSLQLEVQVSGEETKRAFDRVVSEVAKQVSIPGFRKGEAPKPMVIGHVGRQKLVLEACEKIISTTSNKAIEKQEVRVIGQADLQGDVKGIIDGFRPGEPLTYTIQVDIWPEAKLSGDYKSLHVQVEDEGVNTNLIDDALNELRKREASIVDASEGSQAEYGMVAQVDMAGYYRNDDGSRGEKIMTDVEESNVKLEMEKDKYFPGLVEGVLGMKVGDVREVPVDFPENLARAELRGVKGIFEIKILSLAVKSLPELNDEFAKTVSEKNSIEELREDISDRLQIETENIADQKLLRAVEDKLIGMLEVELPETLIEEQTKQKFAAMMSDFAEKGMPEEQVKSLITKDAYEKYKKTSEKNVVRSLRASFAMAEIAKKEGITVSKEEVDDQLALVIAELKGQEIDEERARERIEAQLEKNKVFDLLKETTTIEKIPPKDE